ncbi:hypothetical protein I4U23_009037 [Adineta vaga]|nr:hypothetical protein I4U23_009037 [Adineta vaga]
MFFSLMSRYLFFYFTIVQVHIQFITAIWPSSNTSNIQLLGLFPDAENTSKPTSFSVHSRAMFKAAIILSQQYDMRIDGEFIQWQVAQTDGNRITALSSTCQAVSSSTIAGIVGPALSREIPTIAAFAARINIPAISYSATNPDLSDRISYPAFYRTVSPDNAAAIAIAKLFTRYNWTSAIIIYQNDAYGSNGAKTITQAFSDRQVIVRQTIIFDVTTRIIRGDLKVLLTSSSTRVVVLWADPIHTPSIIQNALDENVLGPQFTWILSSSISLSTFNRTFYQNLIGMLTIEPVTGSVINAPINTTLLTAVYTIWQQYEPETFPGVLNIDYYAMFSFDATWTLILSLLDICSLNASNSTLLCASTIGSSYCFNRRFVSRSNLFDAINKIDFLGVSGPIKFSSNTTDRVNGTYYVARNSQLLSTGISFVPVLKYATANTWEQYTSTNVIVWPGDLTVPPSDRAVLEGVVLRIAIMESIPFTIVSYETDDFGQNTTKFIGYIPDLIALLQQNMKFIPQIILAPANKTYTEVIQDVTKGVYDMMIGDVEITAARREIVSFSSSIFDNSLRIIMRRTPDEGIDFLSFLKPFSRNLWLTLLITNIYAGILVCLLEKKENDALQHRSFTSLLAMGIWYAFGVIVGYGADFHVRTAAGRLLTVGLYIVSIVFVATYTANLASYLTISKSKDPVSGIDDIKNGKLSFNRIGIRTSTSVEDFYLREISGGNRNFFALNSINELFENLVNSNIDAAFIDNGVATYATNNMYCNLTLIGADFDKSSFGIVMPKQWIYVENVDVNVLLFREKGQLDSLRKKWFETKICSDVVEEDSSMGVESLIGLFLIFGVISIMAMFIYIWMKRNALKDYVFTLAERKNLYTRKQSSISDDSKRRSRHSE